MKAGRAAGPTLKEGRVTMEYKGYYIEYNLYGQKEYTVQYCGDDLFFQTLEAAKSFIDNIED